MIPTAQDPVDHSTLNELERLIRIMRQLRDPQDGLSLGCQTDP